MNKFILSISILFLLPFASTGQKKVLQFLHTQALPANPYLENYTVDAFLASALPDQEIDPEALDLELLQATLFFSLCQHRRNKSRPLLHNPQLDLTAYNYLKTYSASYFRPTRKKKRRIEQKLINVTQKLAYSGPFLAAFIDATPLLQYDDSRKRQKYRRDQEDGLFYYKKQKEGQAPEVIPPHTYRSLIQESIKRMVRKLSANRVLKSKGYTDLGCSVQLYRPKKNKIPQVKIMWIIGGRRLNLLPTTVD